MKRYLLSGLLFFISVQWLWGQHFPRMKSRNYVSDSALFVPRHPWRAAGEVFGLNMAVWAFDRYAMNEDFAHINWNTIKSNFRKGPVWDTDKFSTNLFSHPYHGSLYFNAARSNGLNFWQSIPFSAGGSLMWEFFMENEPPSINDMLATTFGGVELGEITYRLSDLFIDNRTSGMERVGREVLTGVLSPVRALNRIITGEAWRRSPSKGRTYSSVPINFIVSMGPRFLAEQENSKNGTTSLNINFRLDYGDPFYDEFYSPYEWFQFRFGMDMFSAQPVISQVNAVGALWGKRVWNKGPRALTVGVFQHFDYYDSELRSNSDKEVAPYRISEAAAIGGGLIYYKESTPDDKVDVFTEFYATGVALGASVSDYLKLAERDYNLGSGYSVKAYTGLSYNKKWGLLLDIENYHLFTWKGYDPDINWNEIDPTTLNVQGDTGHARLTVFSAKLFYLIKNRWSIILSNRYFSRRTHYKYYDDIESSTYDVMLSVGVRI
ncbi:DUF3943 domain-containing protein [Parabacteroides provencensis]|uniref:DUF3943 domain-containing protein n=1 Tax=Parabacteroides provencensis TaxID=1944636 RepID=UPI000C15E0AF|nr:DUF3943 domain-containing protein [Parabacteroides provencensis]